MKAHIYKDKAAVLDYVRNDHKSTDKRLRILNRFNLIVETVSAWLLFVPTYRQVPIWKFPDYHDQILIPGSNIVIRVDEPSSIIAFCLDLDLSQFDTSIECGGGYKYIASRTGKLGTSLLLPHLLIRINGPNGLDIRCTIYYLDEFESLRSKHCGLPLQSYTNSLARCVKWSPQGGKSKASFYKTKDDTFILKELCKNWTIAEKAQLVKFAPHYINYKAAAQSGTLLALLAGFYALSVKAGIGYTLDVSVMNNLFSGLEIITKYDLKGVATRQSQCESVFHDAEWAHGEYPLIPASKAQLDKCISKDTAFLAQNNIMDYSLLVGTCRDTRQLALGIVDFIGSFTFYKLVETTSKLIRNSNPTIIRPDLYKERFQHAIRGYFQSTPDNSLTYIDKLPSPL